MHPLDGCRAKVQRARTLYAQLGEGIRTFTDEAPFVPRGRVDQATNEIVFFAEANPAAAPIPIELPLIAGEIAHQLRSALDHLVWQLVISNTGQPPTGNSTQFPIYNTEAGYNSTRAQSRITGVSAAAAQLIRAVQPYHMGANANNVLTWLLQELNNTDKHRVIPVTTTFTSVALITMRREGGPPVDILPWLEVVREPLRDGMEIARVPITEDMNSATFDIRSGFDLAFEQVGNLRCHPMSDLLTKITNYVERLIESFPAEFPAAPAALQVQTPRG
jgi:hypothetical protein